MIGQTVSHYQITKQLGAGGMGVVYEALDLELDRTVALKFLPPELTRTAEAKSRFVHEAQAASTIDHPNVCNIHEISSTNDGQLFIVMARYRGETVKEMIARGPVPVDTTLDISRQVAQGLAKAHEREVVHRDIKPANIFVTRDGLVKILDFGLAKLVGATRVTREGTIVGSVHYMSPEQVQGIDVDARSDIFSLGVVLYELVTGVLPFQGDHPSSVLFRILHNDPPPVSQLRDDASLRVQKVIERALAKRPDQRYQSADEMLSDLDLLINGVEPVGLHRPSIAVIPFEDLSSDRDQEYFCDGLTEDLINSLTHIEDLRVMARGSVFIFKDRPLDVREIGQKLNVQTLLTGSLRKSGDRLRVTVQLVDVAEGCQMWSERYDRQLTDVFAIQDEIALAVVEALKVKLLGPELLAIEKVPAKDATTYNLYLQGRYHWNKRTEEGLKNAIQYFEQALAREPNFALAHVGLADSYNMLGAYGLLKPNEAYPRARSSAQKALEIDNEAAEAHASLGWVLYEYDRDWSRAEEEFRRAIALKPGYSVARMWYAHFLMQQDRLDEAIQEFKQALAVDPFALVAHANIGCCHYYAYRLEQAKEVLHATLEMDPDYFAARMYLGWTHLAADEYTEAITELSRARGDSSEYNMVLSSLGYVHGVAGNTPEARAILAQLEAFAEQRDVLAFDFTLVHLGLGDVDKALQWLEKAFTNREMWISYLKVHPILDRLRSEQRFKVILARAGFTERERDERALR